MFFSCKHIHSAFPNKWRARCLSVVGCVHAPFLLGWIWTQLSPVLSAGVLYLWPRSLLPLSEACEMQETFSYRGGLPGIENEAQRLFDVVPKRDGIRQQLPLICCVLRYNAVLQRTSERAGYSVTCWDDSAEQEEKKGWKYIFSSP